MFGSLSCDGGLRSRGDESGKDNTIRAVLMYVKTTEGDRTISDAIFPIGTLTSKLWSGFRGRPSNDQIGFTIQ